MGRGKYGRKENKETRDEDKVKVGKEEGSQMIVR